MFRCASDPGDVRMPQRQSELTPDADGKNFLHNTLAHVVYHEHDSTHSTKQPNQYTHPFHDSPQVIPGHPRTIQATASLSHNNQLPALLEDGAWSRHFHGLQQQITRVDGRRCVRDQAFHFHGHRLRLLLPMCRC